MRLVDSHCHLDDARFDADRADVLRRAWAAGLERIVTVGTGPQTWPGALAVARSEPRVACALGLHPHEAGRLDALPEMLDLLPQAVALGEIGLDFHYDFAPRPAQRDAFAAQLELAQRLALPIVIHEREAAEEVLALLDREGCPRGVWHCFSGGPDLAAEVLRRGLHLGFGGLATFVKAVGEAARGCPRDRLLLETDAPYLAPVPYRGRRNEPAFVAATAAHLAALRGEDAGELASAAARNALRLFGLEGAVVTGP
jgi:TatD DNase family protein